MGGTAPASPAFLLVHSPPPWPRAVEDVEALRPLAAFGRVQLVWGTDRAPRDQRLADIECYAGTPDATALGHAIARAPWTELASAAATLVDAARAADPDRGPPCVLVCAHGSRDRCCGALGTRLAATPTSKARILRTSHLGGHRFAPTFVTLPDARYWGYADAALVEAVVARDAAPGPLLDRHRGSALVPSPPLQLLEGLALATVGWAWEGWRRRMTEADGAVSLSAESAAGERLVLTARAVAAPAIDVPPCVDGGKPTAHVDHDLATVVGHRWDARGHLLDQIRQ